MTYRLDPATSWLYVVVFNDPTTMAARLGHDHGIRASTFDGTVVWDAANPAACKVDLSFPVSALTPDPPGMRERAGLSPDGAVGDSSLATIKENLLGKSQLDAATYPTIRYTATACSGATGKVKVDGKLTIHGVTKPVSITLDVKADPTSFSAAGSTTVVQSDFGFKPFSNLAGALKNKDELKLVLDLKGAAK
ncbi:MAG: YceI family protein [Myxococcota bacterium]